MNDNQEINKGKIQCESKLMRNMKIAYEIYHGYEGKKRLASENVGTLQIVADEFMIGK